MKFLDRLEKKWRGQTRGEQTADALISGLRENLRNSAAEKARQATKKASDAVAAGDMNTAWSLYQEAKEHYMAFAVEAKLNAAQVIDLDSCMSAPLADILRIEGKHQDALCHIVYWAAGTPHPMKMHDQQVVSCFKRCKFKNVGLTDVMDLVAVSRPAPDFIRIRETIRAWRDAERGLDT